MSFASWGSPVRSRYAPLAARRMVTWIMRLALMPAVVGASATLALFAAAFHTPTPVAAAPTPGRGLVRADRRGVGWTRRRTARRRPARYRARMKWVALEVTKPDL